MKAKKPIRTGVERGARRRTLVDEDAGIVIDVSQGAQGVTVVEIYAWLFDHAIDVTPLRGPHPAWGFVSRPMTAEEKR